MASCTNCFGTGTVWWMSKPKTCPVCQGSPAMFKVRNTIDSKAAWIAKASREFSHWINEFYLMNEVTCEDFENWYKGRGNAAPAHYNVWGQLWRQKVASGLLTRSGGTVKSKKPKARGRQVPLWRIVR